MAIVIRFPVEHRYERHGKGDGSPAEVFQFRPAKGLDVPGGFGPPCDVEPSDGCDPNGAKWPPADML